MTLLERFVLLLIALLVTLLVDYERDKERDNDCQTSTPYEDLSHQEGVLS